MRKFSYCLVLLALLALMFAAVFYARYEMLARSLRDENHFAGEKANAVKHAYAAAQLYMALRFLSLNDGVAETVVVWLGKGNEYAERVAKWNKPDSVEEMAKDFHNNVAGIAAAQWYLAHRDRAGRASLLEVVVALADKEILVTAHNHLPWPIAPTGSVAEAIQWFEPQRPAIAKEVDDALSRHYP